MPDAYHRAIGLLARREHGAAELTKKLCSKGFALDDVQKALKMCQQLGYQDDGRFAEQKMRSRMAKGYGPERIRLELRQLGIDGDVIDTVLADETLDWLTQAHAVLQKKYGRIACDSIAIRQKQKQFLYSRGFSTHLIDKVLAFEVF